MEVISDRCVDMVAVGRRSPFDTAQGAARTQDGAPNDIAIVRIQCPIHAALLPETDNVSDSIRSRPAEIDIRAAGQPDRRIK